MSILAQRLCWLVVSALATAGCGEQHEPATGVRLVLRYDEAPARLRISGWGGGRKYGPELLPDPPRPLAAAGESVLLELPATLAGRDLALAVEGLDERGEARQRAATRVRVVAGSVVTRSLVLFAIRPERDGPGSTPLGQDASSDDAGSAHDDAGSPHDDTSSALDDASSPAGDASAPLDAGPAANGPDAGDGGGVTGCQECGAAGGTAVPDCGDGICPGDCGSSSCGDGVCCAGEDPCSCPSDCGMPACGDGQCCAAAGEDPCSCPADCGAPACAQCQQGCCTAHCPASGCEERCAGCRCAIDCAPGAECELDCGAGSTCDVGCQREARCDVSCSASSCDVDCHRAARCEVTCTEQSNCTIHCRQGEDCSAIECGEGARCLLECGPSNSCGFADCEDGAISCPGNVLVCGRECP